MRLNEYLKIGVGDAADEHQARLRALEMWREFGLPENVRVIKVSLEYGSTYEVFLAPKVDGL